MTKAANTPKTFFKDREFSIILEKIYGEIKTIHEGQDLIKDKLDSTTDRTGKNFESITRLDMNVSFMKDDMTKMNGKLSKMEDDIFKMKSDISGINGRLTNIEADVRIIKTDFGKRLTHLETVK